VFAPRWNSVGGRTWSDAKSGRQSFRPGVYQQLLHGCVIRRVISAITEANALCSAARTILYRFAEINLLGCSTMHAEGKGATQIAREIGCSRGAIYKVLTLAANANC
jgi:hypothetical protein